MVKTLPKKALIIISLVEEANEVSDKDIQRELFECLEKYPPCLPFLKEIVAITVKSRYTR